MEKATVVTNADCKWRLATKAIASLDMILYASLVPFVATVMVLVVVQVSSSIKILDKLPDGFNDAFLLSIFFCFMCLGISSVQLYVAIKMLKATANTEVERITAIDKAKDWQGVTMVLTIIRPIFFPIGLIINIVWALYSVLGLVIVKQFVDELTGNSQRNRERRRSNNDDTIADSVDSV